MRSILLPIALTLALMPLARGQDQGQAGKLAEFLGRTDQEASTAATNLVQMGPGLMPPESDVIEAIHGSTVAASAYLDKLNQVTFIYSIMRDKVDRDLVRQLMLLQAKHTVRGCDLAIEQINRRLGMLRSPAAIAEAQKVRDLLQKARGTVLETVTGR
jgi:hypothetical protein